MDLFGVDYLEFDFDQFYMGVPRGHQSFLRHLASRDRNQQLGIRGIEEFSMLVSTGFTKVQYMAEATKQGAFFWITKTHAKTIGTILSRNIVMESLAISHTTTEGEQGWIIISNQIGDDCTSVVKNMTVSHKSGDEVTHSEAIGVARLITKLKSSKLSLWAGEFDDGALDKMLEELKKLKNTTLKELDICDITLKEPNDKINHKGLNEFVSVNSKRVLEKKEPSKPNEVELYPYFKINEDISEEKKKKLVSLFVKSYAPDEYKDEGKKQDQFLGECMKGIDFYRLINRVLLANSYLGDYDEALEMTKKIEPPKTKFEKAIYWYVKFKSCYGKKDWNACEEMLLEKEFANMAENIGTNTYTWLLSIATEVFFKLEKIDFLEKFVDMCIDFRMEVGTMDTAMMSCQNMFLFLEKLDPTKDRIDLLFKYRLLVVKIGCAGGNKVTVVNGLHYVCEMFEKYPKNKELFNKMFKKLYLMHREFIDLLVFKKYFERKGFAEYLEEFLK